MKHPELVSAAQILCESQAGSPSYWSEMESITYMLEDVNSPMTSKYTEKLFKAVIDKGHIDFGDIAVSKGDVTKYKGYQTMMETLDLLAKLGSEHRSNVKTYAETILEAIKNLSDLGMAYQRGFKENNEYVMLEYNTILYTCVEATTTLIYEYVDFVKRPDKPTYVITLKNTKLRANQFYFDQLNQYNRVNKNMNANHRKWLESLLKNGKENFTGGNNPEFMIGVGAVAAFALMIIPITRSLVYHIYHLRSNLASECEVQANFLEMNRTCVEANQSFTQEKREKILRKQEALRKRLLALSDKLKIKDTKAMKDATKEIAKENSEMSVTSIRNEIEASPFDIL